MVLENQEQVSQSTVVSVGSGDKRFFGKQRFAACDYVVSLSYQVFYVHRHGRCLGSSALSGNHLCSFSHRGEPFSTKISSVVFSAPQNLQASALSASSRFRECANVMCLSATDTCIVSVMHIGLESVAISPLSSHLMTSR